MMKKLKQSESSPTCQRMTQSSHALMFYNDNCVNSAEVTIVIWKALAQMDIHSENLTGRQLVNLHEILKEEIRR